MSDVGYYKEYWTGNSRDGGLQDGDGYHFFKMSEKGRILEAMEYYESMDGEEVITPMPEFNNVNWFADLGYESMDVLEEVQEKEFARLKAVLEEKGHAP